MVSRVIVLIRPIEWKEKEISQGHYSLFDGENYDLWVVRMNTYLEGFDLWVVVEEDYIVDLLLKNPTMAYQKSKWKKNKEGKGEVMFVCWCFRNDPH